MPRFYSPQSDFSSSEIIINDKGELHHLCHVLRLKKGNAVEVFDGKGHEASGTIVMISSRKVKIAIESVKTVERKLPSIILACAIPKKTKFEMIIEKATELGADEIIPLKTKRTEMSVSGERVEKKMKRYQTVAINAAKQSRRATVPITHPITEFSKAIFYLKNVDVIIPSLSGKRENLIEMFDDIKSPECIAFLIGPEGDFTPKEYALAQEAGCHAVTLGETILKVETAAICVLSCANLFFHAPDLC